MILFEVMKHPWVVPALLLSAVCAHAQIDNHDAPVVIGHYLLNVTSVEAHKKFWVDTLGGTAIKFGNMDAIRFPGIYLFLRQQNPTGPTRGTTIDHIGLAAPDVPKLTEKVVAAGYALTVGREPGPGQTASPPTAGNYGKFSYILGPDGVKVEVVTNTAKDAPPIMFHHAHFANTHFVEMQQWYMKTFDATLRPGQTDYFIGADLPGVGYSLNFFSWLPADPVVGTAGRAIEHIGFEVRNLPDFLKRLEAKGIALKEPLHRIPDLKNIQAASLVDPWGTQIVLTEGLR